MKIKKNLIITTIFLGIFLLIPIKSDAATQNLNVSVEVENALSVTLDNNSITFSGDSFNQPDVQKVGVNVSSNMDYSVKVKGADFITGSDALPVNSMSVEDFELKNPVTLSTTEQTVIANAPASSNKKHTLDFTMTIPLGIPAGTYTGTVNIIVQAN